MSNKETIKKNKVNKQNSKTKADSKKEKFAVIELGGTQYKLVEGRKYEVKKLHIKKGDTVKVENVLLVVNGDDVKIGEPYVKNAKVEFTVVKNTKDKKVKTFKYKAKSRYRKRHGHRAQLTVIEVNKVVA